MVEEVFSTIIKANRISINDNVSISVDKFKHIFGADMTYESLIIIDKGELGYKCFFDRCREEGILN